MITKEERARLRKEVDYYADGVVVKEDVLVLLDALDAAEKERDAAEYDRDRFKVDREAIRSIYLTVLDSKAEAIVDARRAALEEAAGWMDEASRSTNANSNQLAQVEADTYSTAADMLRERAVKP